jgi:hypothetical protein
MKIGDWDYEIESITVNMITELSVYFQFKMIDSLGNWVRSYGFSIGGKEAQDFYDTWVSDEQVYAELMERV